MRSLRTSGDCQRRALPYPRLRRVEQIRRAESGGVEQVIVLAHGKCQHLVEQFLLAGIDATRLAAQEERAVLDAHREGTDPRVLVARVGDLLDLRAEAGVARQQVLDPLEGGV